MVGGKEVVVLMMTMNGSSLVVVRVVGVPFVELLDVLLND